VDVDVVVDMVMVVDADVVAVVHLDAARAGPKEATPDLISTALDDLRPLSVRWDART